MTQRTHSQISKSILHNFKEFPTHDCFSLSCLLFCSLNFSSFFCFAMSISTAVTTSYARIDFVNSILPHAYSGNLSHGIRIYRIVCILSASPYSLYTSTQQSRRQKTSGVFIRIVKITMKLYAAIEYLHFCTFCMMKNGLEEWFEEEKKKKTAKKFNRIVWNVLLCT